MKFYVQGMHCPSCVILTEGELGDLPHVTEVKADLATKSVEVAGDFGDQTPEQIARELTKPLAPHGYSVTLHPTTTPVQWKDFYIALPIAMSFIAVFILLQKLGVVHWMQTGRVTYGAAFMIGVVASLSTCMAVVGGLVLSLSATFTKIHSGLKPHILFHIGRLATFYLLGGVIGALGSQFQLTTQLTYILSFAVGIVLLILGINLLEIVPWVKKIQPTIPKTISKKLLAVRGSSMIITPLLVGAVTFFLPCGFTQSMQLVSLTIGSFTGGSLIMLSFALGTLPVLAALSVSSIGLKTPRSRSVFFKTAGCIVLFFAVINIMASLVAAGILPPVLNF